MGRDRARTGGTGAVEKTTAARDELDHVLEEGRQTVSRSQDQFCRQVQEVVESVLSYLPAGPLAVRLPWGEVLRPDGAEGPADFTLVLKRPQALRRMLVPPGELPLGEGYLFDDFDIEGDIVAAFRFLDGLQWPRPPLREIGSLLWQLVRLEWAGRATEGAEGDGGGTAQKGFSDYVTRGRRHTRERDRRSVRFHYDVSNEFYRLWLDRDHMQYTCACFNGEEEALEEAQGRKLELICRKLDLQAGERFVDIGCGWGGLVVYAAANYGVEATGITLSEAQAQEAERRIAAAGLQERCRVQRCHYEAFRAERPVDKLACIGMSEHVGERKLVAFFEQYHEMLQPEGRFLLQVGCAAEGRPHAGGSWMERLRLGRNAFMHKYSFPDSQLLSISTVLRAAEVGGFELRDVQSLREHYPLTLGHWLGRLEAKKEAAIAEVGQAAYRCWRLVLAGYLHLLDKGDLSEYQVLFGKRGRVVRRGFRWQ